MILNVASFSIINALISDYLLYRTKKQTKNKHPPTFVFFSNTTALGISENYAEFSHINTENECFQVLKRQPVTQYDYNRTGRMQTMCT